MKNKFSGIIKWLSSREAHQIIFPAAGLALLYILIYEFVLLSWPSSSDGIYKLGQLFSKLSYSIVASTIFYTLTQFIPGYYRKREKKIKILANVSQRLQIVDTHVSGLKMYLRLEFSIPNTTEKWNELLSAIHPSEFEGPFVDWYDYLNNLGIQIVDMLRSITAYNEYLGGDLFHEIVILEKVLLDEYVFSNLPRAFNDLTFANPALHEIIIHNSILQKLMAKEILKYKHLLDKDGKEYRERNFK